MTEARNKKPTKQNMNVFVVVPNWNGEDFLETCLESLLSQTEKCNVVVVENGSVDQSDEILASYDNKITVLKQPKNLGFAGGVNVGIKHAIKNGADFVALFNNDAVADKNWLKNLFTSFKDSPNVMIATPAIIKADKKSLDALGTSYSIFGAPFPRFRNENINQASKVPEFVFGGAGGASLYKISLFNEIGLFDEDFFAYYEEDDLNFRAQLAGYQVITVPSSKVYHAVGGTSGKIKGFTAQQTAKNFWYLYTKNMPGWLYIKYLPLASLWYILMFVNRTMNGLFIYFMKGFLASLVNLPKTFAKRRIVQKNRKVSSKQIDSILYHHIPPKNLRPK